MSRTSANPVAGDVSISAPMVAALEDAWAAIRSRHADVPPAVVVLAPGSDSRRGAGLKLGHFGPLRWANGSSTVTTASTTASPASAGVGPAGVRSGSEAAAAASDAEDAGHLSEVLVGGEGLRHGPVEVLDTLLHEAAHGMAHVRGIKDTSRQGRWHNTRYAKLAAELGLAVAEAPGIGWSNTSLRPETRLEYAQTIALLGRTLTLHREPEPRGRRGGRASSNNGLACACACPRRIRVSPSGLAAGPILCGVCDEPFEPLLGG
jgi:hypothetical protein